MKVECYAVHKGDERPLRIWLDNEQYLAEGILDQWYDPEHIFHKVRADDRNLYILRQESSIPNGAWESVSFRQSKGRAKNEGA
jgi:hypothetical protein